MGITGFGPPDVKKKTEGNSIVGFGGPPAVVIDRVEAPEANARLALTSISANGTTVTPNKAVLTAGTTRDIGKILLQGSTVASTSPLTTAETLSVAGESGTQLTYTGRLSTLGGSVATSANISTSTNAVSGSATFTLTVSPGFTGTQVTMRGDYWVVDGGSATAIMSIDGSNILSSLFTDGPETHPFTTTVTGTWAAGTIHTFTWKIHLASGASAFLTGNFTGTMLSYTPQSVMTLSMVG